MMLAPKPTLSGPKAWNFPRFVSSTMPNGLNVHTSHISGKNLITAELFIPYTSKAEPEDKLGLVPLVVSLLDEGTSEKSAEEFSDALELLGASWLARMSTEGIFVGVEVPKENLLASLDLLAEAVTKATIPEKEYERVVQQTLAMYQSRLANPSYLAREAYKKALWADSSRIAHPGDGTPETLANISREDVKAVVASFAPEGSALYLAGDLLDVSCETYMKPFSGWEGNLNVDKIWDEKPADGRRLIIVDRPGAVQTELILGCTSITRTDSQWGSLQVGTHILGGTLTSRIDAVLREEKGYTYGMRANLEGRLEHGTWQVSGSVDTPSTALAVKDLLEVLRKATEGVTQQEVTDAASYLVGVSPLRWENPSGVVRQAAALGAAGLTPEWIDSYLKSMANATKESVDTALKLLPLDALTIVAVGDRSLITKQLEELTGLTAEVTS